MDTDKIAAAKAALEALTPEERLEAMDDYCQYCDDVIPPAGCHCNNDD